MDDTRPQDIHFAWEDIMEFKSITASKRTRRSAQSLSISDFRHQPKDDMFDEDVDASCCSEAESNLSTCASSVAGSHSTHTSISLSYADDYCFDEDEIEFPTYDDGGNHRRPLDLVSPMAPMSASPPEIPQPPEPELVEKAEDDVALLSEPSRHVDYLTHEWCEEDIWATWKYLRTTRKRVSNRERLENASWRLWMKQRYHLRTTAPESINWMKDRDVTWLYGPYQSGSSIDQVCLDNSAAGVMRRSGPYYEKVKSILKKPTLSQVLLRRSLSTTINATRLAAVDMPSPSIFSFQRPIRSPHKSNTFGPGLSLPAFDRCSSPSTKSVRFHDEVEQFVAVASPLGDELVEDNVFERSFEASEGMKGNLSLRSRTMSSRVRKIRSSSLEPVEESSVIPEPDKKPCPPSPKRSSRFSEHIPARTMEAAQFLGPRMFPPGSAMEVSQESRPFRVQWEEEEEEVDWLSPCQSPDEMDTSPLDNVPVVQEVVRDTSVQSTHQRRPFVTARDSYSNPLRLQNTSSMEDIYLDEEERLFITENNALHTPTTEEVSRDFQSALHLGSDSQFEDTDSGMESDTEAESGYDSEGSDKIADSGYFGNRMDTDTSTKADLARSVLAPAQEELVDRVMNEFWKLFNQEWDSNITSCTNGSSSSPTESSSSPNTSTSSSSKQPQRKRQRVVDDSESPEENQEKKRQPKKLPPNQDSDEITKFACPFRKNDARVYNIYNYRVCALSHWQTIARVKEHLYRCHQMPAHCKRCWATFKNQQQLDAHLTVASSEICEVQVGSPPAGITPAIERKLRSRKKSHPNQTDEERWKDIYRLLFPNIEVPSPYFDGVQEDVPSSPDTRELSNYEEYIRRELPRLVRSNIEEVVRRETQPLEAALIGSLVGIIQDCQDRVFRAYRETQGMETDVSPRTLETTTSPSATSWVPIQSREETGFLEAAFQAPHLSSHDLVPDFQRFRSPEQPNPLVFSDSGYGSENICCCQGPCHCSRQNSYAQPKDDNQPQTGYGESPMHWTSGNAGGNGLSYPAWQNVDNAEDEADWWMNI